MEVVFVVSSLREVSTLRKMETLIVKILSKDFHINYCFKFPKSAKETFYQHSPLSWCSSRTLVGGERLSSKRLIRS